MRYHSLTALALLALAHRSVALPDGVGGHHGHHTEHAAAAAPPASGYQEPVAAYEPAADPGYAVPDTGYGTPDYDTGYGYQGYDVAPQEGYEVAEGENGMSMIIIPLLIAAALFLLFPSVRTVDVNSTTGRKRRAADDSPAGNMVERLQDMYMALMESEECMERIACEVGGLVTDAGISKSMTKMAGQFVPKKYTKMMKTFNHGKDCKKNNKCGIF